MITATAALVTFLAAFGYYRRHVGREVNDLSVTLAQAHAKRVAAVLACPAVTSAVLAG